MDRAIGKMNRLTTAYSSANFDHSSTYRGSRCCIGGTVRHNFAGIPVRYERFFPSSRFQALTENLPGYSVRDEHGLKGMNEIQFQIQPTATAISNPHDPIMSLCKMEYLALS